MREVLHPSRHRTASDGCTNGGYTVRGIATTVWRGMVDRRTHSPRRIVTVMQVLVRQHPCETNVAITAVMDASDNQRHRVRVRSSVVSRMDKQRWSRIGG